MKSVYSLMIVFVLVIAAVLSLAVEAAQVWRCEMDDNATEEQAKGMAQEWLKAAKVIF